MTKGSQLYDRDRVEVLTRKGQSENEIVGVLRIKMVRRTDDGLYECMASNSVSFISKKF